MLRWGEFEEAAPEIAAAGRELCTQHGVGLAYLGTVRADGGPRIHPMCPVFDRGGLYAFIVPSPKERDLRRDGRYAMHAFPADELDDEFMIRGVAREVGAGEVREALAANYRAVLPDGSSLFEFLVERALLSRYLSRGDWPPSYSVWRAP